MNNIAKFLIGLATTGITAVGGYYGWKSFNSVEIKTQEDWEKVNMQWLNTKWEAFKKRATANTNSELFKQWTALQQKFALLSKIGLSDLETGRKLKEWCESKITIPDTGDSFSKVREECKNL